MLPLLDFVRVRVLIPFLVFILLIGVLYTSVTLSSRRPVIEAVTPTRAATGETVTIEGRHFGGSRAEGRVRIGGSYLPNAAYTSWSDQVIRFRLPNEIGSGLLYVSTVHGLSEGVLFTNHRDIPQAEESTTDNPSAPFLVDNEPLELRIGELLVLRGRRFGHQRFDGEVIFRFSGPDGIREKSAGADDRDYELWTDREIQVRVPDGVGDGSVVVRNDRGRSKPLRLSVLRPVGEKSFEKPSLYVFTQTVAFSHATTRSDISDENILFIHQAHPVADASQEAVLRRQSGEPYAEYDDMSVVRFDNLAPTDSLVIEREFEVERYPVRTEIQDARVPFQYRMPVRFLTEHRSADAFVPSEAEIIRSVARVAVGNQRNPHLKAGLLLNALRNRMSYDALLGGASGEDAVSAWEAGSGDAFAYASLYTALLRAAEVPSRMIAGFLVLENNDVARHFWVEYYLQDFGWVPVDPALTDGYLPEGFYLEAAGDQNAAEFYFGNLDGRRIAFSNGLILRRPLRPDAQLEPDSGSQAYALQSVFEERVGNLTGYILRRPAIELSKVEP
ncbi:MAG: transglutaminase domain-containing protein [Spirochaetia bacterium]